MSRSFRYSLILVLFGVGTGLAAVAGWRYARTSAPVNGPIVLLSIDALRADRLPAYGYARGRTPAIDALAADGVVFEHAYAHAPLTLPANVALLSGRLPFETGVQDNVGTAVPGGTALLAQMLGDRGYATGGIVSSFALRKATGISRGFAFFDDELDPPYGVDGVLRDGAESEKRAERWLSAVGTSRAFLFLHLSEPHAPYAPPDRYASLEPYDGEVAYADELVGRLVAYLQKQQLYDQSTIILVGGHGESLGAFGEQEHGLFVTDDTLRVPFVIKLPAAERGGSRVDAPVQHADVVPTVLDLTKAPMPGGLAGRSLRSLVEGGSWPARVLYAESQFGSRQFGWAPLATVTDGRFRYVGGPDPMLFDGPDRTNVVATRSDDAARLAQALDAFVARDRLQRETDTASAGGREGERDGAPPPDLESMMRLGYLGPLALTTRETPGPSAEPADVRISEGVRAALRSVAHRQWAAGIEGLRAIARDRPSPDLWAALAWAAERGERYDVAADAYRRMLAIDASDGRARLGLASALLEGRRVEEALKQADVVASDDTVASEIGARAHELLVKIALVRHDPGAARVHAQHVVDADPASPVAALLEGRLLVERGRYEEALRFFDAAVLAGPRADSAPMDAHLLRGDALARLDRAAEAEDAYLTELQGHPRNARAYVALATLYHQQWRHDEAADTLARLTTTLATPGAYDAAARAWAGFGDRARASAVRLDAQRAFGPAVAATAH